MGQEPGGLDGLDGLDGTDGAAPPVCFEPCAAFRDDQDEVWPVCAACGWFEDHHAAGDRAGAVVTQLPRRRVQLPERKAS